MDIDTLLTVIFVVVIILFQLFGAIAGRLIKKNKSEPDKPDGVLQTLKTRVSKEIQTAMDQVAAAQGKSDRPVQTKEIPAQTRSAPRSPVKKQKPPPAVSIREEEELIDQIRKDLMEADVTEAANEVRRTERRPASAMTSYTGADLRRAVIWAEILGPPVALKD